MTNNRIRRILTVLLLAVLLTGVGFRVYTAKYYRAGDTAMQILQDDADVVSEQDWLYIKGDEEGATGLIFYPGAKVEHTAYLPLMKRFADEGINCFLVEMPFHLAIFGRNRAEKVMQAHPEIDTWYMAGHSLGGAAASAFAAGHEEETAGVILLGSYLYGDFPEMLSVTIFGSEDMVLNRKKITYEYNVYVIEGGNHAQFGDYGEQKGDGTAGISADEQIAQTVERVCQAFPAILPMSEEEE